MNNKLYDMNVMDIKGQKVSLKTYAGKVILIVNTASKCGLTPQYKQLEEIYQEYKEKGLVILGFPCNQFGAQEPGNAEEIQEFCELNYRVSFPMFSKIDVNGSQTSELYEYLKTEAPGILGSKAIKWNFTKFLVDKEGNVKTRFAPKTEPKKIISDIEKLL